MKVYQNGKELQREDGRPNRGWFGDGGGYGFVYVENLKAGTYELNMSPFGRDWNKVSGEMPFAVLTYGMKSTTTITRLQ